MSPNTDPEIITETLSNNMVSIPGFYTVSEGLRAVKYGATVLKFFPAGQNGLILINDYKAIFPRDINFVPTGGINLKNIREYLSKVIAVGIGNSLFSQGISIKEFENRIIQFKNVLDKNEN